MLMRNTWRSRAFFSRSVLWSSAAILVYLALIKLVAHLLTNGQYGYHRDELAYLDDARRLDWGFVDHPPFAPAVAHIALALFGPSLAGLRLFPTLASVGVVILTGLMARELGGGRFAQGLAALCSLVATLYLISGTLFQTLSFDQLIWIAATYLFIRLLKTNNPRLWLAIGAVLGLGLQTKLTIVFYAVGLVAATLLSPARKHLLTPWPWLGALLALVIFLPHIIWQVNHNWISLTYLRAINTRDTAIGRTATFLPDQLFLPNPVTLPVWVAGLIYLFSRPGRPFRPLAWLYLVTAALLFFMHGRSYYLGPMYAVLFAVGGVAVECALQGRPAWLKPALAAFVAVGGLVAAPVGLPIAPVNSPVWTVVNEIHDNFREMLGWEEMAASVANAYRGLPPEERARTGIVAENYGEAGAINQYGPSLGLPHAVSAVNTYYYWGPGDPSNETYIVLGYTKSDLQNTCAEVQEVGAITNRYGVQNEESVRHPSIYICRHPNPPLRELWPTMQHFG